jgi:hypothetical protein
MVELKPFRFDYDRPAVLPRSADRETVFNLCRSFLGCIMWSKQDPFQIQIRSDEPSFWPSAEVDAGERDAKKKLSRIADERRL